MTIKNNLNLLGGLSVTPEKSKYSGAKNGLLTGLFQV